MNADLSVLDQTERLIYALRALYKQQGYSRYRMSKFEPYELYSNNKDFLVSDSVLTFTDTNGRLMALKPDVTLSIIKNHRDDPEGLKKLCYNENVYRAAKAGPFREIMQAGLECIGAVESACVGEVLLLAAESLALAADNFVLAVSHLGILSAFTGQVSPDPAVQQALIKCLGEKNLHGVEEVCRINGIDETAARPLKMLMALYGTYEEVLPGLKKLCTGRELTAELTLLEEALQSLNNTELAHRVFIDFSVVGDMNYYNGVLFKGFAAGVPDSVLSGGQYDRLMEKLGRKSKGIGFAVYLDRLERLSPRKGRDALWNC